MNLFKALKALLPEAPLQVGDVLAVSDGTATIELPDGGAAQARGPAGVGDRVFFRDGVIVGDAPNLPVELIEI